MIFIHSLFWVDNTTIAQLTRTSWGHWKALSCGDCSASSNLQIARAVCRVSFLQLPSYKLYVAWLKVIYLVLFWVNYLASLIDVINPKLLGKTSKRKNFSIRALPELPKPPPNSGNFTDFFRPTKTTFCAYRRKKYWWW